MLLKRHFFIGITGIVICFQGCDPPVRLNQLPSIQIDLNSLLIQVQELFPTTPPNWEANIDISRILPMGGPVPDNYPNADLAWGESYFMSSLLVHFEITRDPRLLSEFFNRADQVLKKRDDKSKRFTLSATWTSRSLYEPNFGKKNVDCSNVGLDGMILTPIAEFLTLYKERHEIFKTTNLANLNLAVKQDQFRQAIQEVIAYHQVKSWNSAIGTYKEHLDCLQVDSRNRTTRDFARLPFNLIAAMGRVHFKLYLNNSDPTELRRAISIANDLRLSFKYGASGELYWPYFYADVDPEDRSHGAIIVDFVKLLAEHGVVFNWDVVNSLDKTVRYHILGSSNVVMSYIGDRKDSYHRCSDPANQTDYFACRDLAQWLQVIPYKNWTDLAKSFVHVDSGSYRILANALMIKYSRARTLGQTCSDDGECSTGSCFARSICGYKLGSGSTCRIDSDCHSGHCYNGTVCGYPLGAGSTCTRHHECASGLCVQQGSLKLCQ